MTEAGREDNILESVDADNNDRTAPAADASDSYKLHEENMVAQPSEVLQQYKYDFTEIENDVNSISGVSDNIHHLYESHPVPSNFDFLSVDDNTPANTEGEPNIKSIIEYSAEEISERNGNGQRLITNPTTDQQVIDSPHDNHSQQETTLTNDLQELNDEHKTNTDRFSPSVVGFDDDDKTPDQLVTSNVTPPGTLAGMCAISPNTSDTMIAHSVMKANNGEQCKATLATGDQTVLTDQTAKTTTEGVFNGDANLPKESGTKPAETESIEIKEMDISQLENHVTIAPTVSYPEGELLCDSTTLYINEPTLIESELIQNQCNLQQLTQQQEQLGDCRTGEHYAEQAHLAVSDNHTSALNGTELSESAGEKYAHPSYPVEINPHIKLKSQTLDPRSVDKWEGSPAVYKARAATLGPSGSRKRSHLQPKPAINDDHLYPDSVTPSKVEPLLSAQSVTMGLPDGTYNLPYMDDDAFLVRIHKNHSENKYDGSDADSSDGSNYEPWIWDKGDQQTTHIVPEHIANIDECAPTPLLTPKNKANQKRQDKRQKIDDQLEKKHSRMPKICSCLGKKRPT